MNRSRRPRARRPASPDSQRVGLARALSKLGYCSRSQAWTLIESGAVQVDGRTVRHPEHAVDWQGARIEVHGHPVQSREHVYLMLNKPRGLVTTAEDEQGRRTVFDCFEEAGLPFVSPVGRLDKASEGLLLFTNDTAWADRVTSPTSHLDKTYHVQVNRQPDDATLQNLRNGVKDEGETLKAKSVSILRKGEKNAWLEIVLNEGRNRHIRRMLDGSGVETLRLIRVSIGALQLGGLEKGKWRRLHAEEAAGLAKPTLP